MASFINLTPKPAEVSTTTTMPSKESLEVAGMRAARLSLRVLSASVMGTVEVDVSLQGSMVLDEVGWTTLATFPTVDAIPMSVTTTIDMPLRYLRWSVDKLNGCTLALFQVDGIAWP